jgi:hypothetical protein
MEEEGKNGKRFHTSIMQDIWYWIGKHMVILDQDIREFYTWWTLNLFWGGVYKPMIQREGGSTIDESRSRANAKDKKAVNGIYLNV